MRLPKSKASGLALTELVVLLGFLAIIASAIVFIVDPGQRADQQRDKNLQADAQVLIDGFYGFYAENGVMPWALGVGQQQPAPALPWKPAFSPEVGLCTDVGCTKAGPLARSAKVPADFYQRAWVRNPADYIYVGKGASGPIFACFIPASRSLRKKTGQLYKIDIGKDVPSSLLGFGCPATTTWSEEDVCYLCVAK